MAGIIWEFFGFKGEDVSAAREKAVKTSTCPITGETCEKTFNDGVVSGVCAIKPMTSAPVICCPIRLYADDYKILKDIVLKAFGEALALIPGKKAVSYARDRKMTCVAVFGKRWGGELRLPQKSGKGGYFVDWVLAKIDPCGALAEFVAVEVQTIDTTGSYRKGHRALSGGHGIVKTTVGLNWENVYRDAILRALGDSGP